MSQTQQPKWQFIGHVGDVDPIAYGGGFVYEDRTKVYAPEMTYFEPAPDSEWDKLGGKTPLAVYRILLERDSTSEWWYARLPEVASYAGVQIETLQGMALGSTMQKALIYEMLIQYFGAHEFDSYPNTTTEGKAYFRYWREMHHKETGAKLAAAEAVQS